MTWWIRPGPSRFCAMRKPSPRSPSRFVGRHADVRRSVTSQWVDQPRPRWPMTGTGSISIPGASAGTRIWLIRRCGSASGSVTAMTIPKAAPSAPDENHLRPSITHSSPSSTARRPQAGRVGAGDVRLGHREERARRRRRRAARSQRSFCSSVPNRCRISPLPASGAWQLKTSCAHDAAADLLVQVRVGEEAAAGAARLRAAGAAPRAPRPSPARAGRRRARPPRRPRGRAPPRSGRRAPP